MTRIVRHREDLIRLLRKSERKINQLYERIERIRSKNYDARVEAQLVNGCYEELWLWSDIRSYCTNRLNVLGRY